jgi:hypothetical protein
MRKIATVATALLLAMLKFAPSALAQQPGLEVPLVTPGPGWEPCPRCENPAHIADERQKMHVDTHPFDPHDLSGVWGFEGVKLNVKVRPPFTVEGQKLYDAMQKVVNPKDSDTFNAGDPVAATCDPLGFPRDFAFNYGFEMVQVQNRVFQFFEWSHVWRTVWTDGRKLPDDPPVQRWLGYAVGRWDGDTFIVDSSGFDSRSLVGSAPVDPLFPHSDQMKLEERYKRLNYGLLQASITITDPKVFTMPWTTTGTIKLLPNAEIGEYFCVPSEFMRFNERQTAPSNGLPKKGAK